MRFLCFGHDSDSDPVQPNRWHVDFDPNAEPEDGNKAAVSRLPARTSFKLFFEGELPPDYTTIGLPLSAQLILGVIARAHRMGQTEGIAGAFNVFRNQHFILYIDDNSRLATVTKSSIETAMAMFHSLGRATNSDMTFYFMSQSNTDSGDLTDEEREKAKALEKLWRTKNWGEAKAMVEGNPVLRDLGILQWMDDNSSCEYEVSHQQPSSHKATRRETPDERFMRLLSHVRDLKLPYWQGYNQSDIDITGLTEAYAAALQASAKQPKSLNCLRFTFDRAVGQFLRNKAADDASPTTVIILTGSPLLPTEADAVTRYQKDNTVKKQAAVRGEGSQFCIQTIAWTQHMDEQSKRCLRKIDNANKGEDDINDLTEVHDTTLRDRGPSAELLFKVLNSNHPSVDAMTLKEEDKYGKIRLFQPGQPLIMPSVARIADVLGQTSESVAVREETFGGVASGSKRAA